LYFHRKEALNYIKKKKEEEMKRAFPSNLFRERGSGRKWVRALGFPPSSTSNKDDTGILRQEAA
jgi:hypothetical protein